MPARQAAAAARRPAQARGHPERDRRAAPWRRLQRRPAARRHRGGLRAASAESANRVAAAAPLPSEPSADRDVCCAELEAAAEALTNPPDVDRARHAARPARARPARPAARAPGARRGSRPATGIAMSVLDKQLAELRRRLNTTGDLSHRADPPGLVAQAAARSRRPARAQRGQRHHRADAATRPSPAPSSSTSSARRSSSPGRLPWDAPAQPRPAHGPTATTCARRMAAAARAQRDADDRQPQRRRRRARDHRPSGARPSRRARLGRRAAHRDLGLPLPRRRGHRVQPQRRRALADLGGRPHLPARRARPTTCWSSRGRRARGSRPR